MIWPFKKREKKPTPVWLTFLMVGFVAYAIIGNNISQKDGVSPQAEKASTTIENALQLDSYKDKLLPQRVARLRVQDTLAAKGAQAVCGQQVEVAYRTPDIDQTHALTFVIGEGKAPEGFEEAVVGMAKGGKRTIFTPAGEKYDVELLDAKPALPDSSGYRIIGELQEVGTIYRCGEPVNVHVTLTNIEGKKLYSTKDDGNAITFTTGKSQVFLGLEQGVLGMQAGKMRTLIVPPSFQKTLNGNAPAIDFPLPKKQIVIVDIEGLASRD